MLIRTCSHPPLIETEDMTESNQSEQTGTKVTFKDFIELWDTLFNSPRIKVREPFSLLSHFRVKKKKSFATLYTFMYIPTFFHFEYINFLFEYFRSTNIYQLIFFYFEEFIHQIAHMFNALLTLNI